MSYMDQRVSSSTDPSSRRDEYEYEAPPYKRSRSSPGADYTNNMQPQGAMTKINFPIPEGCVGLVIGRSGTEIQAISQKSGCRVTVCTDQTTTGYRMVEIFGVHENIETAKQLINEVVARAGTRAPYESAKYAIPQAPANFTQPQEKITVDIPIPANKCGSVIGKGGETMRKLRAWSNCHIQLIQENNIADTIKPLRITGDPKSVEQAKSLVAEILSSSDDTPAAALMAGNGPVATMSLQVKVPRVTVGAIMGLQGKTIRKLSDDTGTKIQFLPDDDPKLMERSLAIIGNRAKVHIAAQLIKEIVDANKEAASMPVALFYMSIPASKCGLVIGRGGETIKQINAESGALCELSREPSADINEKTFVIKGTDSQVEHAKHLIRIKVGDIPPNTPWIPQGMQQQMQHQMQPQQPNIQMWSGQPIIRNNQPNIPPQYQQVPQPQYAPHIQPHVQPHMQPHIQPQFQPHLQGQPQQQYIPQNYQPQGAPDWQQQQQMQARQQPQQYAPVAGMPVAHQAYQQQQAPAAPAPVAQAPSAYAQLAAQAGAQQVHQQAQAQQSVQHQQPHAAAATSAQPTTETREDTQKEGEADYSEQWLQYYISLGDKEAADGVRARIAAMKEEKARKEAAARASSQYY